MLAYPCQDNCDDLCAHKTEKASSHQHDENDCHSCSPFCFCNCCHVSTIVSYHAIINIFETIPVKLVSIIKEVPIKDILLSIWQPPEF